MAADMNRSGVGIGAIDSEPVFLSDFNDDPFALSASDFLDCTPFSSSAFFSAIGDTNGDVAPCDAVPGFVAPNDAVADDFLRSENNGSPFSSVVDALNNKSGTPQVKTESVASDSFPSPPDSVASKDSSSKDGMQAVAGVNGSLSETSSSASDEKELGGVFSRFAAESLEGMEIKAENSQSFSYETECSQSRDHFRSIYNSFVTTGAHSEHSTVPQITAALSSYSSKFPIGSFQTAGAALNCVSVPSYGSQPVKNCLLDNCCATNGSSVHSCCADGAAHMDSSPSPSNPYVTHPSQFASAPGGFIPPGMPGVTYPPGYPPQHQLLPFGGMPLGATSPHHEHYIPSPHYSPSAHQPYSIASSSQQMQATKTGNEHPHPSSLVSLHPFYQPGVARPSSVPYYPGLPSLSYSQAAAGQSPAHAMGPPPPASNSAPSSAGLPPPHSMVHGQSPAGPMPNGTPPNQPLPARHQLGQVPYGPQGQPQPKPQYYHPHGAPVQVSDSYPPPSYGPVDPHAMPQLTHLAPHSHHLLPPFEYPHHTPHRPSMPASPAAPPSVPEAPSSAYHFMPAPPMAFSSGVASVSSICSQGSLRADIRDDGAFRGKPASSMARSGMLRSQSSHVLGQLYINAHRQGAADYGLSRFRDASNSVSPPDSSLSSPVFKQGDAGRSGLFSPSITSPVPAGKEGSVSNRSSSRSLSPNEPPSLRRSGWKGGDASPMGKAFAAASSGGRLSDLAGMRRVQSTGDLQTLNGMGLPRALGSSRQFEDGLLRIGKYTLEERKLRISRYRQKRNERNFSRKIKYQCRKTLADSRPRIHGRFARNGEVEGALPGDKTGKDGDTFMDDDDENEDEGQKGSDYLYSLDEESYDESFPRGVRDEAQSVRLEGRP